MDDEEHPTFEDAGAIARVALFIYEPGRASMHSSEVLRRLYGLSASEAKVARALANGHSIEEIASARGTALSTIRSQLKSVFRKTDSRRQSEVVKLVLGSPIIRQ